MDRYIAALAKRDPAAAGMAAGAFVTENNVALQHGDGLWNTVTALGPYDLRFCDVAAGPGARFTCAEETDATSPVAIRLEVTGGAVTGAEITVARNKDDGFPVLDQHFEDKPAMRARVPEGERASRAELLALANG